MSNKDHLLCRGGPRGFTLPGTLLHVIAVVGLEPQLILIDLAAVLFIGTCRGSRGYPLLVEGPQPVYHPSLVVPGGPHDSYLPVT